MEAASRGLTFNMGTASFRQRPVTPPTYEFVTSFGSDVEPGPIYTGDADTWIYVKFNEELAPNSFLPEDVDFNGFAGVVVGAPEDLGSNTYKFQLAVANEGTFDLSIKAGAVSDISGDANVVGGPTLSFTKDSTAPVVTIVGTESNGDVQWTDGVANLVITIDEDNLRSDFDPDGFKGGITVWVDGGEGAGASIQSLSVDDKSYTATLTITDKSADLTNIVVKVAQGIITDLVGNQNAEVSEGIPNYIAPVAPVASETSAF